MLVLSIWTAATGNTIGPSGGSGIAAIQNAYALTTCVPAIDLGLAGPTTRVPFLISASSAVLGQIGLDYRFPSINFVPLVFSDYQNSLRIALQNRLLNSSLTLSVTIPNGSTVPVPATPGYQAYFAALAAKLNAGLTYGSLTTSSTLGVQLPGGSKTVTVAVALGFYKLYLDALATWSTAQATIECAQQISDLDALTIP